MRVRVSVRTRVMVRREAVMRASMRSARRRASVPRCVGEG